MNDNNDRRLPAHKGATRLAAALALALAGGALAVSAPASAAGVVYDGVLISGLTSSGNAGGFSWFLDQGASVDYWRFQANAGDTVTLQVRRLSANFDPALTLYSGMTGADTAGFSSSASWGGLGFLGSLDDEARANLLPGPNGDPLGSFKLAGSGWYTVVVGGSGSTDAGFYNYLITATLAAAVPEPAPAALLAAGLAGVLLLRRGRRRR